MSRLSEILSSKRRELDAWPHARLPELPELRSIDLRRANSGKLSLISEIKLRSPSAGPLSRKLSIEDRATAYQNAGAAMLSVLVDGPYFEGDYSHLGRARAACALPILCKEFVIDPRQVEAARAFGADAVLLIVRCLAPEDLRKLICKAETLGLAALVEVHDPEEVSLALDAGAKMIGVNARNLDSLEMKPEMARQVLSTLPASVTRIHLSGVATAADVQHLVRGSADAALVGEALMRQDDPGPLLSEMVAAAR